MWDCFMCQQKAVFWNSDVEATEAGYEEEGIVGYYTCSKCGAFYEVFVALGDEEEVLMGEEERP